MGEGDEVTWEANHLGRTRRLTVRVTKVDRPRAFEDQMVSGPFARMRHDHRFEQRAGETVMIDDFDYALGYAFLGAVVARLVVTPYLRGFLRTRALHLKSLAERRT